LFLGALTYFSEEREEEEEEGEQRDISAPLFVARSLSGIAGSRLSFEYAGFRAII
jgi:hypothetical protein